jgi:hypothetical protein
MAGCATQSLRPARDAGISAQTVSPSPRRQDPRDVEIADHVKVEPVVGGPGLVFVDDGGRLLAVSEQDLGAAVAAGQR